MADSMKRIESYEQLIEQAIAIADLGRKKHVAVAAAQDPDVIEAIAQAEVDGFLEATLVGDKQKIKKLAAETEVDISKLTIRHEPDVIGAAQVAVSMASTGDADAVMKGFLPTSALLKTILDKKFNLRGNPTISHCAVLDIPGYHKLINFTDGGMVVAPNSEQKLGILENALMVSAALGLAPIKVAVAGPTNFVTDKLPGLVEDAEMFIPQAKKQFAEALVDGPFPLDIALDRRSAMHRRVESEVAGDADIYLFDSIEACNITAKSLINFGDTVFAGVIVGAKVPISLVSRTDTARNKRASLAMACLLADYYQQHAIWDV